jgi:RNase H-like domain found in reverse transcriptase
MPGRRVVTCMLSSSKRSLCTQWTVLLHRGSRQQTVASCLPAATKAAATSLATMMMIAAVTGCFSTTTISVPWLLVAAHTAGCREMDQRLIAWTTKRHSACANCSCQIVMSEQCCSSGRGELCDHYRFFSQELSPSQSCYSTFDRELTAVVATLQHFCFVLEGWQFHYDGSQTVSGRLRTCVAAVVGLPPEGVGLYHGIYF